MFPRTTLRRRVIGAVLSLGLASGGVLLGATAAISPASAEPASCTATMSPASIRPGESATMSVMAPDGAGFEAVLMANGHIIPGRIAHFGAGSMTQDHSWWSSFGIYVDDAHPTSTGYRLYGGDAATATDATPYLCQAQVTLLPAAPELPDPVDQSVTVDLVADVALSVGTVAVSARSTSGLPVALSSTSPGVCTVDPTTSVVTLLARGRCSIQGDQAGNEAFKPAPAVVSDFYVQGEQTITFAPIGDHLLTDGSVSIEASADSHRRISFTSNTPAVCVLEAPQYEYAAPRTPARAAGPYPATVLFLAAGTCSVTASQTGGFEWLPAEPVTRTFAITTPITNVLRLSVPTGAPLSARTVALTATGSASTSPVALTSLTPSVCAINGRTATLLKAGVCAVRATQTGAAAVTKSFPVWATPVVAKHGKATGVITVLGAGEGGLQVRATPATVCRTNAGRVLLIAGGSCTITVLRGGAVLRATTVKVAYPKRVKPSDQLALAGTAYFAFDSASLTTKAKKSLRALVPTLKSASLVVVYGNTYGSGKNSAHSTALSAERARAVVSFLSKRGVKAKAVKVAAAMKNPVSATAAKNRRADIYVVQRTGSDASVS